MPLLRLSGRTRLFAGAFLALLFAFFTIPLTSQTAPASRPGHSFGAIYDSAREITINGTIQEVVTHDVSGSPAGLHLLVAGSQGVVDAHLGPFVSNETKGALASGSPVRIVGAMTEVRGKQYLLARELTVAGRTVTIRNRRGSLAMPHGERVVNARASETTKVGGGAQ